MRMQTKPTMSLEIPRRLRIFAALAVADRIIDADALGARAVPEEHLYGVADVPLFRVEVIFGEIFVFPDFHSFTERIDAGVGRYFVLVIGRGQAAEYQGHGRHVLDAVIAVGRINERPGLVDELAERDAEAACVKVAEVTWGAPALFR